MPRSTKNTKLKKIAVKKSAKIAASNKKKTKKSAKKSVAKKTKPAKKIKTSVKKKKIEAIQPNTEAKEQEISKVIEEVKTPISNIKLVNTEVREAESLNLVEDNKNAKNLVLDSIKEEEAKTNNSSGKEKKLFSQEQVDKNLNEIESEYVPTQSVTGAASSGADDLNLNNSDSQAEEKSDISISSREEQIDKNIESKSKPERLKAIAQKDGIKTVASSNNKEKEEIKNLGDEVYQADDINIDGESELTQGEEEADQEISKSRSIGLYKKIALSFISLTFILIAVVTYFYFIKVTIIIVPNQERVSSNLIIDIYDKEKNSSELNSNSFLGIVKQIEVEESKIYQASGEEIIAEEVMGKVTLINNYTKNQPLVATTRLLTQDNKLFRIKETVNVPAGGKLEVDVYADEPGQEMIIGPTNFTIPGLWTALQDKIYAESNEPMKYSQQVKMHVTKKDIGNGLIDIKENLLVKAEAELSQDYSEYDQVIFDLDDNSIIDEVDAEVDDEVEEFTILAKTMVTIIAFNDNDIYQLAQQKLLSAVPENKTLINFNKEDISYNLNNYNIAQGTASINANFYGKMMIGEDASIIDKEKLVGLNQNQLDNYLKNLPEIAGHEIKFTPSFIKKVPSVAKRIEIIIKQ